ncbi:unnamed protein product [Caenorhabditis angaria]|uniref:aralkylamine N-acetyltransferase n=1 Tax=Caenorhabditis angaria TaxID=860376 RepID=A0A9P1MVX5_9PELO|nr:unnamed protein product [Caenorhabditis angaria]
MQLKKFNYRLAVPEDADRIIEFLKESFCKDEPVTKALNMSWEEIRSIYTTITVRSLQYPFSTIVTTDSGEIAAVLLNSVSRRTDLLNKMDFDENSNIREEIVSFEKMVKQCHASFWTHYAPKNIDAVIHREVSSVSKKYQRNGIATRMVRENMKLEKLDEYMIGGIISETTSFANQTLLAKQGFKTLREIPYSSVVDSRGNTILKTSDGAKGLRLNFKPIEEI